MNALDLVTATDIHLLTLLALTAIAIVRLRNLFAVALLSGAYSLFAAALFVILDAVDVAFTEAAVGAGVSTVLMLGALLLTGEHEKRPTRLAAAPFIVSVATGFALFFGTLDMPAFGDPNAPVHQHVAPDYLARSIPETQSPNVVTSVLASYRGYDTLGETFVIFAAVLGVLVLLGRDTKRTGGR